MTQHSHGHGTDPRVQPSYGPHPLFQDQFHKLVECMGHPIDIDEATYASPLLFVDVIDGLRFLVQDLATV